MARKYDTQYWSQDFKCGGTIDFGKEVGKMVLAKIDSTGKKAHEINLSELKFTPAELHQIDESLHPKFQGTRGGFGQTGKKYH